MGLQFYTLINSHVISITYQRLNSLQTFIVFIAIESFTQIYRIAQFYGILLQLKMFKVELCMKIKNLLVACLMTLTLVPTAKAVVEFNHPHMIGVYIAPEGLENTNEPGANRRVQRVFIVQLLSPRNY